MSDTPPERNSNSQTNLIEVQHVGVTAKLQSPLKGLLQTSSSSTETEHGYLFMQNCSKTQYNKFCNDTNMESESTTDNSKVLYEMRAIRTEKSTKNITKITPSKIEFQLYNKPATKRIRCSMRNSTTMQKKRAKRKNVKNTTKDKCNKNLMEPSVFQRLRYAFENMRYSKNVQNSNKLFDLPEPKHQSASKASNLNEGHIGIYLFEHGNAEYLRTTDCHPQILSIAVAERATHYATRFWAEFFGSLHIGVSFIVTFFLQTYRFLLYSLINTLFVGFLDMTSDYFIKPILTVLFNGFLQPPLILLHNVLSSIRDLLEPIADTLNNFMKPIATVGKSLRLVHVTYNEKKTVKDV